MSLEEEKELCELSSWGDRLAMEALFHANYGLIGMIIKEHNSSPGIDYEDLYAEGAIGLWRGIELYRLDKGTKLASYCKYWIHYRVKKALELKSRVIRVPRYLVQRGIKHIKKREAVETEINRELTEDELKEFNKADELGRSAAEYCIDCVSIHKQVKGFTADNGVCTIEDTKADAAPGVVEALVFEEMMSALPGLLKLLPIKNRRVLKKRFGIGCKKQTLEVIAAKEGVTREWVRQLEKEALLKLREFYETV